MRAWWGFGAFGGEGEEKRRNTIWGWGVFGGIKGNSFCGRRDVGRGLKYGDIDWCKVDKWLIFRYSKKYELELN